MNLDILLIEPPQGVLKGMPSDRGYNLGLTSLAAYLRQGGIETAVLMGDLLVDLPPVSPLKMFWREYRTGVTDLARGQLAIDEAVRDSNHIVWKNLADVIRRTRPRAVGIAYLTPLKHIVEKVASLVRELDPEIRIIAGSFHPSFCPGEVMQNPDIDFVIRGEGEIPLLALVNEIKKSHPRWETVPGIYYRDAAGQVKNNPVAGYISNLDELPLPARDLVLNCDYTVNRSHAMVSARGCPYICSFCADRNFWGGKIRRRSVDSVIAELKMLKEKYNPSAVDFVDGTFTYDRKYLEALCNALIEQKLNVNWRCTARFDNLDEPIISLMKQSGCSGMYLGLESGSQRMLDNMNKKETVDNMVKVAKLIHDAGLITVTSVLIGLPDESNEDVKETLRLMKIFRTDFFDVNSYIPLPGAPLYETISPEDIKRIDWRTMGYKSFDNYFSKKLSREEFRKYQKEAYGIADKLRRRSLLRFGGKMLSRRIARLFKKSDGKALPFSYT